MKELSKEQIEYIFNNKKKKSVRQIAKELGIGRVEVEKVLGSPTFPRDEISSDDGSAETLSGKFPFLKKYVTCLTLLILVAASLFIRRDVYLMPHLRGDQRFYIGTAMKLEKEGINGYTLRGVDIKISDYYYAFFDFAAPGNKGSILHNLSEYEGVHYYDMPILTTPPLFSYALMYSHKIFSPKERYFIPNRKWETGNDLYTSRQYAKKQFYAVVVPLFFSSLLIMLVFLTGKHLFGYEAAVWASFLMVICPTDILTSQKVWADDMTAFFVALTLFLFLKAKKHNNVILSALAGVSSGLGAITKATGGFIVFVIVLYHLWTNKEEILKGRIVSVIFDKHILAFLLAGLLTIVPWYGLIAKTYGKPWHIREAGLIDKDAPWFKLIHSRPWFLYLVNIPMQTPVLFIGYFIVIDLFNRIKGKSNQLLLFLWYGVYLFLLKDSKEERYMLAAIPALAIATGLYLHKIRLWIDAKAKMRLGFIVISAVVLACAMWSVPLAWNVVLTDDALVRFPF